MNSRRARNARLAVSLLLAACGGDSGNAISPTHPVVDPPPGAVAAFTVSPVALDSVAIITPLGNLAPPGHVLPTDHAYMYAVDFDQRPIQRDSAVRGVYAPATGAIDFMYLQAGGDSKVQFRVTEDFSYYLDHVVLLAGLTVGTIVHAGDLVGHTNPGGAIDLGAWDRKVTNTGFVNPRRYGEQSLHVVSPWSRFTEPLRSQIYARLRRHPSATERDARIDFGVTGRLVGDWFHESLPVTAAESSGPNGWPKSISFAFDYYDPSKVRISIGGTLASAGVWGITPEAPRPRDVQVASGKVAYRLMYTESTQVQYGLLLVEMLAEDRLRIEVFVGNQDGDAAFDGNAMIYLR
ncbi:MAG: hypothetical protein ABI910_20745 [Gemmatimonadota bacterium]